MTEPQWAVLLFENVCQVPLDPIFFIGVSVTLGFESVDLQSEKCTQARVLLRRICITCKLVICGKVRGSILFHFSDDLLSFSLVVESKFKTRFPGVNPEILELIRYMNGQRH